MQTLDLETVGWFQLNIEGKKSRRLDLWRTNNAIAALQAVVKDQPRDDADAAMRKFVEGLWDCDPPEMPDQMINAVIDRIAAATLDTLKKPEPAQNPSPSPS